MAFTFAAAVAWDPIGKQAVKNTSFQVYATADTGFVTPLAITDTFGVTLPGNILNSGSQGVFPEFEQEAESTVVITDPAHTYVWTVTAVMQDTSVAAFVGKSGSASEVAVKAAAKSAVSTDLDNPASEIATKLSATYAPESGSTKYIGVAKDVGGGKFPKPQRLPTLVVDRAWPEAGANYRILFSEAAGQTLYGLGLDNTLRKSTDGGKTWAKRGLMSFGVSTAHPFLKTSDGVLLTFRSGTPGIIQRSTDDGATWASVLTTRSAHYPMGSNSWAIDRVTGYIYYGEYVTADTDTETYVYRSTDNGATWTIFHTFPGYASASADKIRHIHSVQWDHVAQRVVVMCGDDDPAAGMYRVNAAGTALEPLLLNRDVTAFSPAGRAIGIMPFPDYLAWGGDTTGNPWIMRMARTEIGKASPVVERVYRLNTAAWFTCQASADGTRWVITSSGEGPTASKYDSGAHVYAVEDQGATVYELGSISAPTTSIATLSPVGEPGLHGETFLMQSHQVTDRAATWRMQLTMGTRMIPWPEPNPVLYGRSSRHSGLQSIPATGTTVIVGKIKVPRFATKLHIFDIGVAATTGAQGDTRFGVRPTGSGNLVATLSTSEAAAAELTAGGAWNTYTVTANGELEVVMYSQNAAYTGAGFVDYAFSNA